LDADGGSNQHADSKIDVEEGLLNVKYDDRLVEYEFGERDEVQMAYDTSIHKIQGSEYPAVVIPLAMQHYTLLDRNLIYTAVLARIEMLPFSVTWRRVIKTKFENICNFRQTCNDSVVALQRLR
jgi:hypothetical protein